MFLNNFFFHFYVFLGFFFALKRHIFFQHTPTRSQLVLKCAQKYAGQSTIGCVHEQNSVSELKN